MPSPPGGLHDLQTWQRPDPARARSPRDRPPESRYGPAQCGSTVHRYDLNARKSDASSSRSSRSSACPTTSRKALNRQGSTWTNALCGHAQGSEARDLRRWLHTSFGPLAGSAQNGRHRGECRSLQKWKQIYRRLAHRARLVLRPNIHAWTSRKPRRNTTLPCGGVGARAATSAICSRDAGNMVL